MGAESNGKHHTDQISSDLSKVNVYVGSDNKLHFVNRSGADSVLPFSAADIKLLHTITVNADATNWISTYTLTETVNKGILVYAASYTEENSYKAPPIPTVTVNGINIPNIYTWAGGQYSGCRIALFLFESASIGQSIILKSSGNGAAMMIIKIC